MVQYIVQSTLFQALGERGFGGYFTSLLESFPLDIWTISWAFNLEGQAIIFAACSSCHMTYPPVSVKGIPVYPEECDWHSHGSLCGELLIRNKVVEDVVIHIPLRPYIAFDFKDWMAGMLSRTGYEEMMDGAWVKASLAVDGSMSDIFQESTVHKFKGPDEKTLFHLYSEQDAGHYLLSLCYDSFNPLGNKATGKDISIGMISLACLNLPIEERYKPENIFLAGIVPGHKETPTMGINPYLHSIIDAFLEFWTRIHINCTALFPSGRLVYCAIIAVVCDQSAAQKIGGYSSYRQCHFCYLDKCSKDVHGYHDFDCTAWEYSMNEEIQCQAADYLNAPSPKEAQSHFDKSGIRWCELLMLLYYRLDCFVVVDIMHDSFFGLVKEHFQMILDTYGTSYTNWKHQMKKKKNTASPMATGAQRTSALGIAIPDDEGQLKCLQHTIAALEVDLSPSVIDGSQAYGDYVEDLAKHTHLPTLLHLVHSLGCLKVEVDNDGKYMEDSQTKEQVCSLIDYIY